MQIGFDIRAPTQQERGAFASKNYNAGDIIASFPIEACIALGESQKGHGVFPAENAHGLAIQITTNKTFLLEHLPYFSTLPPANLTLTSELFTEELEESLQSPQLAKLINRERAITDAIYYGMYVNEDNPTKDFDAIPDLLGSSEAMHPYAFRYISSIINSRHFSVSDQHDNIRYFLMPVADMINCDASSTNVQHMNNGTDLLIMATKPIRAGEELFNSYMPGLDHRNDMTLAGYGFVRKLEVPLLPATDLPTYDPEHPYNPTPADDSEFYGPNGKYNTVDEYERLGTLLAETQTTEGEDQSILDSGTLSEWQEEVVVTFRMERKKAIRMAMKAIFKNISSRSDLVQEDLDADMVGEDIVRDGEPAGASSA